MKNIVEPIAVTAVALLFVTIIGLIAEYNLIDSGDDVMEDEKQIAISIQSTKKEKVSDYLKNLEGYEEVDVKVDPKQEEDESANIEETKVELKNDDIVNEIDSAVNSAIEGY